MQKNEVILIQIEVVAAILILELGSQGTTARGQKPLKGYTGSPGVAEESL